MGIVSIHALQTKTYDNARRDQNRCQKFICILSHSFRRATRNCPWKSELWRRHMLALERNEEGKAKLDEVYAKALAAGFSTPAEYGVVIGAYLDFMRRRCGKIQREPDGE